ncbi:MAG: membrane dipeptidase, partial [Chloroflexi bacterium]|nr:membrane dipeptidase [Chloroflexota bacterium]
GAPEGLSELGKKLLPRLSGVGMILDASHMSEAAFFESRDLFEGTLIASHSNCRAYVNTDRQLSDEMIREIVKRDGVIGSVIYNRFIKQGWDKSSRKEDVTLADLVRHVQRVCEIAGDARHVGIGTDFDGGYGAESIPAELNTIADLPRIADALAAAKFSDADIGNYFSGNWLRVLQRALPA